MDVIPKVGVGRVRFGMSPAEVAAVFPEEQRYEDWMGGNRNDSLLYQGIVFGFDRHDAQGPTAEGRLVEFTVFGREDARLWGRGFADWSRAAVAEHLARGGVRYEIHENGDLSVPACSMTLSFAADGRLEYVEASGDAAAGVLT